jgi:CubicO group peptidase (beta-lactamase class C family)
MMKFSRTLVSAALMAALCTASCTAFAAPTAANATTTTAAVPAFNLDADVNRVLKTFGVPGMAIAIVKDGKVVTAKGYGVRQLGEPKPVGAGTLFEVASNSKAFTAAALAMLVDEGKLAGFQMYDAYVTGAMTVRDLLTHRSGLGLGAGDLLWWPTTSFSTDEIISRLRYIKPATSFRNSYAYDNLLYIVAGKIIAEKDGKPWGDAIRDRILTPLGMDGTTTSVAAMLANERGRRGGPQHQRRGPGALDEFAAQRRQDAGRQAADQRPAAGRDVDPANADAHPRAETGAGGDQA